MAERQLIASVVFQELLEELVLPHCELVDELEYFNMFSLYVLVRLWLYQVRNLSHDNFTVMTCTLEQFTHKNNDAKHKTDAC